MKVTVGNAISRDVAEPDDIVNARVEGGFFLERAIERILLRYETDAQLYPVVIAVTDRFERAILPDNFLHLKHTFAEADIFLN
ncbi:MAG: hypothetical protein HC859_03675 [Bacteroidia bacterium]|nr:hypothetical protein [Bacteroidia bacterium]